MRGIYLSAAGLMAEQVRAAASGRLLSNLETPGFLGEMAVLSSTRQPSHRTDPAARTAALLGPGPGLVWPTATPLTGPGVIRNTGVATDLAILGPGFFVLAGGDGETLTRNGCFRTDGEGYLCTLDGRRVLGVAGPIRVDGPDFVVTARGEVFVNERPAGRLRLEVPGPGLGPALPGGVYRRPPGSQAADDTTSVFQGGLEYSGRDPVDEVVGLMTALRGYEAAQRAARAHDDALQRLLDSLGNF